MITDQVENPLRPEVSSERIESALFHSDDLGRIAKAAEAEVRAGETARRQQTMPAEVRKSREAYRYD